MATAVVWPEVILPPTDLPSEDGVPMETPWHRAAMTQLIDSLSWQWRDRMDCFIGGNMFVYYSVNQARNHDFRGPDFFVVKNVERYRERKYWAVWDEDARFPDMILELVSPTTAEIDRTIKKDLYERTFRAGNYFCFDPATGRLEGWELAATGYSAIEPDERGWLWSSELQLWLGSWHGEYWDITADWPRFFTREGELVRTAAGGEARRAEVEARRADAAEAEVERLRQELHAIRTKHTNGMPPTE